MRPPDAQPTEPPVPGVLSIFGYKIGVLKSPALFQGKDLQVTRFKVVCFW